MEQPEILLKGLGLTEYESRAYVTLVRLGVATAEQISDTGSIPLPRVYDTLVELQNKGFVLISKGRPKKFKPVSAEIALQNFLESKRISFEQQIDRFRKGSETITKHLSSVQRIEVPSEKWTIWSTEKRQNVISMIEEQMNKARKEVLIFSGDMSWFPERMQFMKNLIKKKTKVRVIMSKINNDKVEDYLRKSRKLGLEVKTGYTGSLRGHVVDGVLASIATKYSKEDGEGTKGSPGSEPEQNYELIIFDSPILVNAFRENFEFWWEKLK